MRRWTAIRGFAALLAACAWCGPALAQAPALAERHMVVAGHPLAAAAGRDMLRAGGNAVDAAVAAALVLTLVEPQDSGIGGGGFLLHADAAGRTVTAYDGRSAAPAAADPAMFVSGDGVLARVAGGRAVAVPGLLRMLEAAHRERGRLPWADLFAPAIGLAETGFPMSRRLVALVRATGDFARSRDTTAHFFAVGGGPKPEGTTLRAPALAETLRAVARGGADAFYTGALAHDIAAAVARAPVEPGTMTAADLARYAVRVEPALCRFYRGWRICTAPPPAGGVATLAALALLEPFELRRLQPGSVEAVHLLAQAGRLAHADRRRWLRDPTFGPVPVDAMLAPGYLAARGRLIDPARDHGPAPPGAPVAGMPVLGLDDEEDTNTDTTHVSVVDGDGAAVSLTATIGRHFGSGLMVRGFLLNDDMNAFSRRPDVAGVRLPNRIEPGKRPRSAMSPVLAFDPSGRLRYVVGSPGGVRIVDYVVKALVGLIDWGLDVQKAANFPNSGSRGATTELERGTPLEDLSARLEAMGHTVRILSMVSGLAIVEVGPGELRGGADPRREGIALGD